MATDALLLSGLGWKGTMGGKKERSLCSVSTVDVGDVLSVSVLYDPVVVAIDCDLED